MPNPLSIRRGDRRLQFALAMEEPAAAPEAAAALCEAVAAFLAGTDASPDEAGAVQLALEELITNIAKFGAPGRSAPVRVEGEVAVEPRALSLAVVDDGPAFDPAGVARPDLGAPPEERPIGGLGLHLLRELFPELAYRRDGARNISRWRRPRGMAPPSPAGGTSDGG